MLGDAQPKNRHRLQRSRDQVADCPPRNGFVLDVQKIGLRAMFGSPYLRAKVPHSGPTWPKMTQFGPNGPKQPGCPKVVQKSQHCPQTLFTSFLAHPVPVQ